MGIEASIKREQVLTLALEPREGWEFRVTERGVFSVHVAAPVDEAGEHAVELAHRCRLNLEPGCLYFVDVHGDVARSDFDAAYEEVLYRGAILIHASSKKYAGKALSEARAHIARCSGLDLAQIPEQFPTRTLLGAVDTDDCVTDHPSMGDTLRNGQLGAHGAASSRAPSGSHRRQARPLGLDRLTTFGINSTPQRGTLWTNSPR